MTVRFEIRHPLPSRRSAEALREQIIEHFIEARPSVGERFLSEYELARAAGLSRPTVRRAMEELHREGWIERRSGMGTFVGPRAALPLSPRRMQATPDRHVARLAVLVHSLGDFRHDWYTPGVLAGIDEVAHELGVAIELVGEQDRDLRAVARRLMQTRPDVLACVAPQLRHAGLISEAQRLDIPCIGTGTLLAELRIPCVYEDGVEGVAMAVRHLAERGHKRIAFLQPSISLPWVFQRHQGYLKGLRDANLPVDNRLVLFMDGTGGHLAPDRARGVVADFLESCRPTAVVLGNFWPLHDLGELAAAGRVRIPHDLSVVSFDQHPDGQAWLGGVRPTVVTLPLRAMGRQLARMARDLVDGKELASRTVQLPCELQEGDSVQPPSSQASVTSSAGGSDPGDSKHI